MPLEEVSHLRVRKYRNPQKIETVESPESLKTLVEFVSYDKETLSDSPKNTWG